jgi:hypothetical protein
VCVDQYCNRDISIDSELCVSVAKSIPQDFRKLEKLAHSSIFHVVDFILIVFSATR